MKKVSKKSPIQNFIIICPHSPQTVTRYTYTHTDRTWQIQQHIFATFHCTCATKFKF